jgi:hypothetical protein
MSKFRITYPSGAVEEYEQSDCDTIEQFENVKFGSVDYKSQGVEVALVGDATGVSAATDAEEKPAETPQAE